MIVQTMRNSDASSFEVSSSPRLFWQGRESGSPFPRSSENQAPYDPDSPYSASKRPSLENLKRASRVKNSNMLRERNQEYDPASVYVPQRPLATSRNSLKATRLLSSRKIAMTANQDPDLHHQAKTKYLQPNRPCLVPVDMASKGPASILRARSGRISTALVTGTLRA
jgi:dTDP-D-glucose 4,6-dehydratase